MPEVLAICLWKYSWKSYKDWGKNFLSGAKYYPRPGDAKYSHEHWGMHANIRPLMQYIVPSFYRSQVPDQALVETKHRYFKQLATTLSNFTNFPWTCYNMYMALTNLWSMWSIWGIIYLFIIAIIKLSWFHLNCVK